MCRLCKEGAKKPRVITGLIMKRRAGKNYFSTIIFHPIFVGMIGFCILIYITIPIVRNAQKQKRINDEIKELEKEVTKLDGNNADLKKMINYLNSDQFVLEQARLNLNYKKDKEEVVVIKNVVGAEANNNNGKPIFNINEEKREANFFKDSNIYKWWQFFAKS